MNTFQTNILKNNNRSPGLISLSLSSSTFLVVHIMDTFQETIRSRFIGGMTSLYMARIEQHGYKSQLLLH